MSAVYYGPHHKQFIGKFSPQPHLGIKTRARALVKTMFGLELDEPKYITILSV
jgi:hypothetical protein